ncbi:hypothetical protein IEO21_02965 [Rhodonia placenta]|uniref:Uncharacterized protein n=1 Tax=Rhodonia placenta TaxID=104341 RepID=A0A8H7U4N3_9APHY|nr:hypothetical protein IEO21_02965 [Postia placenta]
MMVNLAPVPYARRHQGLPTDYASGSVANLKKRMHCSRSAKSTDSTSYAARIPANVASSNIGLRHTDSATR